MNQEPLGEELRFEQAWAKVCEHFQDALLITRTKDGMRWRTTDDTWALGAITRFHDGVIAEDLNRNLSAEDME